ncbi:MAG: peptide-methionine (S)-S-oxide reductase MsrA [Rhizobiaceae bacterium]|nr:peptide-methionine (S)-S-oxide reductase MsrA [Rhizobiaceae bacterium]
MFFLGDLINKKTSMPAPSDALPGRAEPIPTSTRHFVSKHPIHGPYPDGLETVMFGMGCFWGAERLFWQTEGVWVTAVGYAGGYTPNPTYQETCTGLTGHAEVVLVVYDPKQVTFSELLAIFWESHDPTQGMRQGNDVGTTYRSAIYTTSDAQHQAALASRDAYQAALGKAARGRITTEIREAPEFYFAEAEHQQYLAKNPYGYCGLQGTGVSCPLPAAASVS